MKKSIINLVIALIIVFQVVYFYKNTTNDVLLNVSAKQESNDFALVHLDKVIDILLENVDSKQSNNFFIITNKETLPYEAYGIGYLYLRWKLYPNFLPTIGEYNAIKATPEYIDSIGKNYDLDYVFVFGKDTNFFGYTTEADITLFHLDNKENNQYSYVDQINLSLYDLYNHDKQLFNKFVVEVKYNIAEFWNFYCIGLMYNLVNDAYLNGNYELAKTYGKYYLDTVDYINDDVNIILAEIYYKEGKYELAKEHFNICLRNSACDLNDNSTYNTLMAS